MKKILSSALILVIFLGFIAANLPANFIYSELELPDNIGPLNIQAIDGSIWNGRAALNSQNDKLTFSWQIQPLSLVKGQLSAYWEIAGSGLELSGHSQLVNQQQHTISGSISPGINTTLSQYLGFYIPNSITIDKLLLSVDENAKPTITEAKASWPGGEVNYQDLRFILPPLQASAQQNQLLVTTETNNSQLVEVRLNPDGWLTAQVFNALMHYSDTPSRFKQPGVSFSYEEKLF